ncbi:MAG: hypothetical protein A2V69_01740 [Candidatus Portnoybacteria bacterium RBG_13_40_8]|uniref:Uncharacterized protein n=1 Tax=Candidatus Portnoybacteria bacterium RBG_13_40_8 TaxID=1801990 RepID=A0A1G2F6E1_9BACT|nr:MAG: hypothetical protein A2V69_01740 [Candidatus Portnoybacteria bacterium RBG_13_40_8]OGZ35086.1 MAG: hypothetical protein A2V60_02180 [Candidatus Portnoybacteria bacterium RIFCSPHIGHO2_01_FULL_39_19]
MERTREGVLKDIKEHPENHHHDFDGLHACCVINGALDTLLMEAHQKYANLGTNGGQPCDVTEGPCSCGAWH